MRIIYPKAAGLDVHKKVVVAAITVLGADGQSYQEKRNFEAMTADLLALSDWLMSHGVTHVAMESTGEYWKPVFNILENNFTVMVVNAQHVSKVPGRKTDQSDAEWIAELMQFGMLKASFIPPVEQRELRELTRYRSTFVRERAKVNKDPKIYYRPELNLCPTCREPLKRDHILWHKRVTFSTGAKQLVSWAYRCPQETCPGSKTDFRSRRAEAVHLKYRRFSRELVVRIGYQHFWQHQTMYEIHNWLAGDLHLEISKRAVAYLLVDFLALLRAAQPAKIQSKLKPLQAVIIGVDGMQPEKGNDCLYIVRELQCGVTLLAENMEESSQDTLCERIFEPLKDLIQELRLSWGGVISDAQETLRLAIAKSLPGTPHQACQSHCLRDAGKLTFEADRAMKTDLKASFRHAVHRLRKRILALPAEDPFRAVLLDFVAVIRSLLLKGGIAPFELGGIEVFDALEDLEASVIRCQKKATTSCSAA